MFGGVWLKGSLVPDRRPLKVAPGVTLGYACFWRYVNTEGWQEERLRSQLESIPLPETESKALPAPWKPPGQLLHSSEGRVIPVWPRSFKNPTWDTERPACETGQGRGGGLWLQGLQCAWGRQQLHGGQTVHLLGSWHLALMVQSHLLLPRSLPTIPVSLPALYLSMQISSQIGPQFRVKYSDFSNNASIYN